MEPFQNNLAGLFAWILFLYSPYVKNFLPMLGYIFDESNYSSF